MDHRTRTVAQNEQCTVQQCTCGMLHVSVGAVTVRLRPPAAGQLRDALVTALEKIEADEAARGMPRPSSRGEGLPS